MQVEVLGCHGAPYVDGKGASCKHYRSSSLRVNEAILIDAGTSNGLLTTTELAKIKYIFLSHAHLDHLHSIPFIVEQLAGDFKRPIIIAGTEAILSSLKNHIFNDAIWPDFTTIPNRSRPILRYKTIREFVPVSVEGLKVTAIPVNHTVPAVGYLVEDRESAFVYSGDTYRTEAIWDYAARKKMLKAAFIESSFPNRLGKLAYASKHLTPELTYQEFLKIKKKDIPLYIYHMKVPYLDELKKEVKALPGKRIRLLADGKVLTL